MHRSKLFLAAGVAINLLSLIAGFTTNFSTTVILAFCVSAVVIIYSLILHNKKMVKLLNIAIILFCGMFLSFNFFIYNYGKTDNISYNEDAVIILGAGVVGETPSLILEARLQAALDYYKVNPEAMLVVTGGQGPGESVTEATAMERYLSEFGVPKERIIKEERAATTCENIEFSKDLLDKYFDKPYKTVIVTNDFHIFRSMIIARNLGMESTHAHAKIPRYSIPANYLRESIAIIFQVAFSCQK